MIVEVEVWTRRGVGDIGGGDTGVRDIGVDRGLDEATRYTYVLYKIHILTLLG